MTVEELAKRYKVGDHTVTRFASERMQFEASQPIQQELVGFPAVTGTDGELF
jgi:DNA-binding MurR/RpiR family transcriptional regulator